MKPKPKKKRVRAWVTLLDGNLFKVELTDEMKHGIQVHIEQSAQKQMYLLGNKIPCTITYEV